MVLCIWLKLHLEKNNNPTNQAVLCKERSYVPPGGGLTGLPEWPWNGKAGETGVGLLCINKYCFIYPVLATSSHYESTQFYATNWASRYRRGDSICSSLCSCPTTPSWYKLPSLPSFIPSPPSALLSLDPRTSPYCLAGNLPLLAPDSHLTGADAQCPPVLASLLAVTTCLMTIYQAAHRKPVPTQDSHSSSCVDLLTYMQEIRWIYSPSQRFSF